MAIRNGMKPMHPGEILLEEYLKPLGMSVNALAKALRVPSSRMSEIVLKRRGITADTALRLSRYFGGGSQSNAMFWLNLQSMYDLRKAEILWQKKIDREVVPHAKQVAEEQAEAIRNTPATKVVAPVVA